MIAYDKHFYVNNLSIILPCYNPPKDWELIVVDAINKIQTALSQSVSLCIVNDGSPQDISEGIAFITSHVTNFTFIDLKTNRGKGYALRQGVAASSSAFTIYTDIDFPYNIDSILSVYEQLEAGNDVVAGVKDATYYVHTPLIRKWISKLLRFFIRLLLNMKITDTQCGLKGFNPKGKKIFLETTIDRYLFDLEFIYLSSQRRNGLKVTSIEAQLRPGIIFRKMNYKVLLQEARNFLKIMFK